MAESLTLTSPVSHASTTTYTLDYFIVDVGNARITAYIKSNNAETIQKVYDSTTSPTGAALLSTINTGNFTTNSLVKGIFNRLIADGVIVGTVGGTPT